MGWKKGDLRSGPYASGPDLEISWGPGHHDPSDPYIRLWSKNKRGPGAGAGAGAGPPAPYPGPATDQFTMGRLSGLVFSFSTKR